MPKRSRGLGRVAAGQTWSQGLVQETGTFGHSRKRVHVLPPVQAGRALPRAHSITCFTGFNSRIKSPKDQKTKACVLEGMRSLNDPRRGSLPSEVPESMRPRKIEVQLGKAQLSGDKTKTIEHSKVA
jgi:hypothetical protein